MPQTSRKTSFLIVLGCLAIVCLPLAGGLQREMAHWHLAAAANAIEFGSGGYQSSLQKAADTGIELASLHDFWMVQIDKKAAENPFDLPVVLDEATKRGFDEAALARRALQQWLLAQQASKQSASSGAEPQHKMLSNVGELLQLRLQESSLTPEQMEDMEVRNMLAYRRALAGVQLDKALADINLALSHFPNRFHFLDTRAWVYYQLNEFDKALEDIDEALARLDRTKSQEPSLFESFGRAILSWVSSNSSEAGGQPSEDQDEPGNAPAQANTSDDAILLGLVDVEAVLRSHRAMILEALGRNSEAQLDWDWLSEREFPTDGSLE